MEFPQFRGGASETTLFHVHPRSFLYPFSSKYSFMTKFRKILFFSFFQIYIKIWQSKIQKTLIIDDINVKY